MESTEKNTLTTNTEIILKLVTAVLGVLYVIGLLVSNMHLMKLGISDFTSLQARNIMTGFLFVIYFSLLLLVVAPISIAIFACGRTITSSMGRPLSKFMKCLGTVVAALFTLFMISYSVGILSGYMYPWGRAWDAAFTRNAWTWQFTMSDFQTGYLQFIETFWYSKIIVASLLIMVSLFPLVLRIMSHFGIGQDERANTQSQIRAFLVAFASPFLKPAISFLYLFIALPLLLVGFAQEIYPNIPYNFGGGQPDIAELQISNDKPTTIKLPGIGASSKSGQREDTVTTDPVVIWYQSDKFLYLASLVTHAQGPTRLVAIDIKLVRTIRYLPKSVRVAQGGRILSVHSE